MMKAKSLTALTVLLQLTFSCSTLGHCPGAPQAKLTAFDASAGDGFGISAAIDGSTAVIGAYHADSNGPQGGAAYVYELSVFGLAEEQKLTAADAHAGDWFGRCVAVEGNTIVVGSYAGDHNQPDTGAAYVFTRTVGEWSQQQKLSASDAASGDRFGISVALGGDVMVVGAYGDDNYRGAAYVFVRTGPAWSPQQKLTGSSRAKGDHFGYAVAMDGNTIMVGAYRAERSGMLGAGRVYVFELQGATWVEREILAASDGNQYDYFGCSVAVDGNTAVIGAYECDFNSIENPGAAYVFAKTDSGWVERQKLFDGDDPNVGEDFGRSVAIENERIFVGCPRDSVGGRQTGSVFEFVRASSTWVRQQRITADGAQADAGFGQSVAVSAENLIVGAPDDGNDGNAPGSAYIFAALLADLNGDCDVDFYDYAVLARSWLQNNPLGDIAPPPDGLIDFLDLNILCNDWLAGK